MNPMLNGYVIISSKWAQARLRAVMQEMVGSRITSDSEQHFRLSPTNYQLYMLLGLLKKFKKKTGKYYPLSETCQTTLKALFYSYIQVATTPSHHDLRR